MLIEKAVLIYGAGEDIRRSLESVGFPVIFVPEEKNGLAVSEVLSLSRAAAPARLSAPFALFHGFSGEELDRALSALAASGAGIELRAVTTPKNLGWSGERLCRELAAERKALNGRKKSTHKGRGKA